MSFEQMPERISEAKSQEKKEEEVLISEYGKMAGKYFGGKGGKDYEAYLMEMQRCWYFSPRSPAEGRKVSQEGPDVNRLQDEAIKLFAEDKAGQINIEQGGGAKFMAEHFDEICQEYKIHIQPTRVEYGSREGEFRPFYVDKLLKTLANNPGFRESIDRFKVSYRKEAERSSGGFIPDIVIYPRPGRENFGKALAYIYKCFEASKQHGSDVTPRYNHKVNELIFVSQSGGDFKDSLKDAGVLDAYFDEKHNCAFRKGMELPLTLAGSESFVELFAALDITYPEGLRGMQRTYKTAELKKLINQVRGGKADFNVVPRTDGLRARVAELFIKEAKN